MRLNRSSRPRASPPSTASGPPPAPRGRRWCGPRSHRSGRGLPAGTSRSLPSITRSSGAHDAPSRPPDREDSVMSTYLTETRYPLELPSAMPDVWELWQRAKTLEWDPETDIPWEELHPERYPEEQIMAARLAWSPRTWGEDGAMSESPALLLRFCLENRLPDLRFFFTMRTQEEGRHAEASWLMADRLGGYFPQPQNPPTATAVGPHGGRRMAFDPDTSLEGIFASLVCAAEEILIDAFKATVHKATNPAVRRLMELILRDEVRHIAFGWQCLDAWAPTFTPDTVRNIERAVTQMIQNVEFNGYRNLWLA